MTLNEILDKLPFIERINDLLVVESDVFGLRAAVFVRDGQEVRLAQEAMANYDDFTEGLKTVVSELRQQGWAGQHAVMLNPAVASGLITLPIPPKNKLSPQQIAEQVRWEMDPLLMQQTRQLTIGQLLVQQGYMTQAQVEEVLAVQNEANASRQRDKLYKRFGEQAQEMHFLKRLPCESTLRRQAWFKGPGEVLHCGWKAQSGIPDAGGFSWLASAVNKNLLRQWQAAFISAGLKLHGCLPLAGNSLGIAGYLPPGSTKAGVDNAVVYEVHAHQVMMALVQKRKLTQMQLMAVPQQEALAAMSDFLHTIDIEDDEPPAVIVIDASGQSVEQAKVWLEDVTSIFGREPVSAGRMGQHTHAGMAAAARSVMNIKPWIALSEVLVGEPAPVWYKRAEFRTVMAITAMLSAMVIAELSVWMRYWMIHSEKATVDVALSKQREAIAALQKQVDLINGLKDSIQSDEVKTEQLRKGLSLIEHDLPKRNQSLVDILRAFELSVSDDVVVDSLTENPKLGFAINAWSLSEASAQEFAKRFQVNVHHLGYHLKDSTVSEQVGRLGLLGYAIKFKVTTLSDEDWVAANLSFKAPIVSNSRKK